MTIPRKTIRKATVTRLQAAATAAGSRVYGCRVLPVRLEKVAEEGPYLLVYALNEDHESDGGTPDDYSTTLELGVEAIVVDADGETAEDTLDDLCEEVEIALLANSGWRDEFESVERVRTDLLGGRGRDAEYLVAGARVVFELEYTSEFAPTFADALTTVQVDVDNIDPGDGPDADSGGDLEAQMTVTP